MVAHNDLKVEEVLTVDPTASNIVEVTGNVNATDSLLAPHVVAREDLRVGGTTTTNSLVVGDATINGNLHVAGSTTTIHTEHLAVKDSIIGLGNGNGVSATTLGLLLEKSDSNIFVGYRGNEFAIGETLNGITDSTINMTNSPLNFKVYGNIIGNGSGLTSLNASNIISGTINNNLLPDTISGKTFSGDGSGLTRLNASQITLGTISNDRLPSTISGKTFSGDGSGLTDLNASNIISGTFTSEIYRSYIFNRKRVTSSPVLASGQTTARQTAHLATDKVLDISVPVLGGDFGTDLYPGDITLHEFPYAESVHMATNEFRIKFTTQIITPGNSTFTNNLETHMKVKERIFIDDVKPIIVVIKNTKTNDVIGRVIFDSNIKSVKRKNGNKYERKDDQSYSDDHIINSENILAIKIYVESGINNTQFLGTRLEDRGIHAIVDTFSGDDYTYYSELFSSLNSFYRSVS